MNWPCLLTAQFLAVLFLPLAAAADDPEKKFWEAARNGDAATVKALLEKGVDVNTPFRYGATALSYACDRGHVEVVKVLLEHGAEVNAKDTFYGVTPLDRALRRGHIAVVKLLLDSDAEGSDRVLSTGAVEGKKEMVKIVLDRGGLSAENLTAALSSAMGNGHTEVAELLRQAGALPPVEVALEMLQKYAGTYRAATGEEYVSRQEEYVFSVKEGKLYVGGAGWGPLELSALNETTLMVKRRPGILFHFKLEGDKVRGLTRKSTRSDREDFYKKVEEEQL